MALAAEEVFLCWTEGKALDKSGLAVSLNTGSHGVTVTSFRKSAISLFLPVSSPQQSRVYRNVQWSWLSRSGKMVGETLGLHHRLWNVRPPRGKKGQTENINSLWVQRTDRKLLPVRKLQSNSFFIERRTSGRRFYYVFYVYQQARILASLVIKPLKKAYGSACHGNEWLKGKMFLEQPLRQMALSGSVPHDLICSFSFKYRGPLKSPSLKFTPT